MTKVKTHLMFQGQAKKAIDLYSSAFKDRRKCSSNSNTRDAASYN